MSRGAGLTGIEFGKVRVYSTSESIDKIYENFTKVMKNFGYPEEEHFEEDSREENFDPEEVTEEELEDGEDDEEEEQKAEEMGTDYEESPWLRAAVKKKANK